MKSVGASRVSRTMSRTAGVRRRRRGRVTGNTAGLVLVVEEEVVRAVLVAENPAAVVERVLAAHVLEADRALVQVRVGVGLLAGDAGDVVGHGTSGGGGL